MLLNAHILRFKSFSFYPYKGYPQTQKTQYNANGEVLQHITSFDLPSVCLDPLPRQHSECATFRASFFWCREGFCHKPTHILYMLSVKFCPCQILPYNGLGQIQPFLICTPSNSAITLFVKFRQSLIIEKLRNLVG